MTIYLWIAVSGAAWCVAGCVAGALLAQVIGFGAQALAVSETDVLRHAD
jgi:hypothetical protein